MLPLQQGGCGIEWEEARNVIKTLSMNSLGCQPVFQDADSVVSEINVLSGTSRADGAEGQVEKAFHVWSQGHHQPPRSSF